MLRAAAVGGGAYVMGKRRAEREMEDAQAAPMQEAPIAPQGPSSEDMQRLQELARLHEQGVITDEELAQQKARILG